MRPRLARVGSLLLAGLLLGSLGPAVPAAGQQQEPLELTVRSRAATGRLAITAAMSGSAWTGQEQLTKDNFTATIDGRPVQITGAKALQDQGGSSGKLAVILAVDTSGSMRTNNNIATARLAAETFAGELRPDTGVGVVSFDNQARVDQELTTDAGKVLTAIRALTIPDPQSDTALWDAVVLASQRLATLPGARNLVVVSDGRHEGTDVSIDKAIAEANKAKVTVDTIGLEVPGVDQDQGALKRIADRTGGTALPVTSAELQRALKQRGQELASQYLLDIVLPPGLGVDVDFRLQVEVNGLSAEHRDPDFLIGAQASPTTIPTELPPAPALSRLERPQGRYLVALLGFMTILLLALVLIAPRSSGGRPYRTLRQRLSPYSLTSAIAVDQPRLTAFGSSEWAGKATAMAETLVRRGNLEETFLDRLEAAGLNMRVAEFVLISLGSAFIPPLLILALTRNLLLTVVVVLLGVVGPFLFLAVKASRRRAKFDEQLPSTLQLLSGALRAGHSLQQAVDTVVHEAGEPIAGEFQRVLTEARLGRPLEEAFEAMAKRTGSVDFEWTVMAIRLQRQVGGNLAEVLHTVAQTIRDRYSLKRQIRALSAEGRLSSLILSILPILMFAALLMFNPLFLAPLYTTAVGLAMLAGGAVLMIVGVFWLKKITDIKV